MRIPAFDLAVVVGLLAPVAPVCRAGRLAQGQVRADGHIRRPAPAVGDVALRVHIDLPALRGDLLLVGLVGIKFPLVVVSFHHIVYVAGKLAAKYLSGLVQLRQAIGCAYRQLLQRHLPVSVKAGHAPGLVHRQLVHVHLPALAKVRLPVKQCLVGVLVPVVLLHGSGDGLLHGLLRHHRRRVDVHRQRPLVGEGQQPVEGVGKVRHHVLAGDLHADVRVRLEEGDHLLVLVLQHGPHAELVQAVPRSSLCRHLQLQPLPLFHRRVGQDARTLFLVHQARLCQHGGLFHPPLSGCRPGDGQGLSLHPPGQHFISVVGDHSDPAHSVSSFCSVVPYSISTPPTHRASAQAVAVPFWSSGLGLTRMVVQLSTNSAPV